MFNKLINRYVRHALSLGVGYLTAKGALDPETGSQVIDVGTQAVVAVVSFFGITKLSLISDSVLEKIKSRF